MSLEAAESGKPLGPWGTAHASMENPFPITFQSRMGAREQPLPTGSLRSRELFPAKGNPVLGGQGAGAISLLCGAPKTGVPGRSGAQPGERLYGPHSVPPRWRQMVGWSPHSRSFFVQAPPVPTFLLVHLEVLVRSWPPC